MSLSYPHEVIKLPSKYYPHEVIKSELTTIVAIAWFRMDEKSMDIPLIWSLQNEYSIILTFFSLSLCQNLVVRQNKTFIVNVLSAVKRV